MYKEHRLLNNPPYNIALYRYMDFTKFVSLLEKQSLYFPRSDMLEDPFEGSYSKANEPLRDRFKHMDEELAETLIRGIPMAMKSFRYCTYINCWHMNNHESEAMWKLYSKEGSGIAIKTNFNSLKTSFIGSDDIYIGTVNYIDYNSDITPENNSLRIFLYKRKSFEHEREVRVISQSSPDGSKYYEWENICSIGKYYEVDLSILIHEIVIYPFAPDWFLELVKSVSARYNISPPIIRSNLCEEPTWG